MRISDGELKKLLLDKAKVSEKALTDAMATREQTKKPLLQTVIDLKLVSEKDLTKLYCKSIGVPFVELNQVKVAHELLVKIPERIARKYQAIIFGRKSNSYQLAMADPEDLQAADFIEKQVGQEVEIYCALPGDIIAILDQYKGSLDTEITKAIKDSAEGEAEDEQKVSAEDLTEDAPIAKTVNIILEYAVKARASDIHIEPREGAVQVRYRIDGVLHESMTLPKPLLLAIVSRIKILANLKIDEHRIPQDGRFKVTVGSTTVALRVSTLPIMDGEKVVMRLLDESTRAQTLEELGFGGHGLEVIRLNLSKPHGMTLVTGPTGSGKSTTLYSALNMLNSSGVNISTVEDPVEYRIGGVNQTQVNTKTGMTFANGLRALLRQDPNIIMVGEIRDSETADLAIQAALTGHLVLSTLHTNNAATSLPRLLEMGVEPFLIASTVNTVVGQRLVRKLCLSCRAEYTPSSGEISELEKDFQVEAALDYYKLLQKDLPTAAEVASTKKGKKPAEKDEPANTTVFPRLDESALKVGKFKLYKPGPGCDECGKVGYQGRMGIYEVLEVTPEIGQMIVSHATSDDIQNSATKAGMLTMQQDGFVKCIAGITSVEEVLRVTRE